VITSALFFGWALAIVLFDCFQRRVPNALVFAGLLLACLLAALGCSPFHASIATALLGVAAGLFALLPFFMIGVMGGADVKVFAALGAWCGVHALPQLWVAASLAAGVHALFLLSQRSHGTVQGTAGESHSGWVASGAMQHSRLSVNSVSTGRHRASPYAAFLAMAAIGLLAIQTLKVSQ
jgi:prepilin peptidase CpaA